MAHSGKDKGILNVGQKAMDITTQSKDDDNYNDDVIRLQASL